MLMVNILLAIDKMKAQSMIDSNKESFALVLRLKNPNSTQMLERCSIIFIMMKLWKNPLTCCVMSWKIIWEGQNILMPLEMFLCLILETNIVLKKETD